MNIFQHMRNAIITAIETMVRDGDLPEGLDLSRIAVEIPPDARLGDISTNAAMILSKQAVKTHLETHVLQNKPQTAMPPGTIGFYPGHNYNNHSKTIQDFDAIKKKYTAQNISRILATHLGTVPGVAKAGVAGPGFINLRLADSFWLDCLRDVLRAGRAYGDSDVGAGRAVNVEYVSANPTGPLHVGHGRGAVFGDALSALLNKAGYNVVKEYYINDAGAQVDVLARSAHLRYREALGEAIGEIPDGLYPGSYLEAVGAALAAEHGERLRDLPEADWLGPVREAAVAAMMDLVRDDLAALGIVHDVFTSERALVGDGRVEAALAELERRGLVYVGVLEPPKGKLPEDWEERPQTLFRSTEFGDDVDRPLKKSDGSWTYFASDIAYHLDKWRRGEPILIDVWGADHGGYVKRVQAAVKALTDGKGELDVKLCQLVRIMRDGETVRMSKREGSFVTLREVIDEVGKDVVRFIMLTRKNDAPLDFDLVKVTEQSRDNPVFYVQYAHARARSVLRSAAETFGAEAVTGPALADGPLDLLADPDEIALIRQLAAWPRVVEAAAEAHEPHRLAFYLHDLAGAFHAFWTRGKDEARLRFIVEAEPHTTRARLALVQAIAAVIASGLDVFGVEPVDSM